MDRVDVLLAQTCSVSYYSTIVLRWAVSAKPARFSVEEVKGALRVVDLRNPDFRCSLAVTRADFMEQAPVQNEAGSEKRRRVE